MSFVKTEKESRSVRQDPDIQAFLARLPVEMVEELTEQQLRHLRTAIGTGQWRKHPVDVRGTFPIPFLPSRVYFVFLMGRNRRKISRHEHNISWVTGSLIITSFLVLWSLLGLFVLYIAKSALGIDLIPSASTGIWDWFKGLFSE